MKVSLTVWIDIETALKLREEAEKRNITPSNLASKLLTEALR